MTELRSEHLWPLVERFASPDTGDPENTVPGWVALAMLDDLRRLRVNDLAAHWPDLEDVPEGRDLFAQYPVAGLPDAFLISFFRKAVGTDERAVVGLLEEFRQWREHREREQD